MLSLCRFAAYLLLTFVLIPVQIVALWRRVRLAETLPVFYHRLVCWIFGLQIEAVGIISTARPTLFVANHGSYIDIEILGSLLPAAFVAKSEVKNWPLFGFLARLQRTVFVNRTARSSSARQRDSLTERLQAGGSLVLFPEGTSDDGIRLKPFKSALFSVCEIDVGDAPLTVQPVTIAYTHINDLPIGRAMRPLLAWYGDMGLISHMWTLIGLGRVNISVQFHAPVNLPQFGSRKRLAEYCERIIGDGLAGANSGRLAAPAAPAFSPVGPQRSAA